MEIAQFLEVVRDWLNQLTLYVLQMTINFVTYPGGPIVGLRKRYQPREGRIAWTNLNHWEGIRLYSCELEMHTPSSLDKWLKLMYTEAQYRRVGQLADNILVLRFRS